MKMHVSQKLLVCAITGVMVCCTLVLAGCASAKAETQTLDQRVEAAQISHAGRFETSGSHGCYGCHGSSGDAWPMLASAPKLPAFHFSVENPTSYEDLDETYQNCSTCHVAITGVQEEKIEEVVIAYADEPASAAGATSTTTEASGN